MDARRILSPCTALLSRCVDILFPRACPSCGAHRDRNERLCCPACMSSLVRVFREDAVYRDASAQLAAEGLVADLIVGWYFEKEGVLRELIHALKYRGLSPLGHMLGRELGKVLLENDPRPPDALLPVPLHPLKMRERGFNQCDEIARGIASVTGQKVEREILRRRRWTPSQTALRMEERRQNVRGAFVVPPDLHRAVHGKSYMLVDDILTTGSTLRACAEALRDAGTAGIRCLVLALPPRCTDSPFS